jgi:hypothetical protein
LIAVDTNPSSVTAPATKISHRMARIEPADRTPSYKARVSSADWCSDLLAFKHVLEDSRKIVDMVNYELSNARRTPNGCAESRQLLADAEEFRTSQIKRCREGAAADLSARDAYEKARLAASKPSNGDLRQATKKSVDAGDVAKVNLDAATEALKFCDQEQAIESVLADVQKKKLKQYCGSQ